MSLNWGTIVKLPSLLPLWSAQQALGAIAVVSGGLILSGCVASSPAKQSNLASVLSPTDIEKSAQSLEAQAPAGSTNNTAPKPAETATKTALADASSNQAPAAIAAAEAAAKPKADVPSATNRAEIAAVPAQKTPAPEAKPPKKGLLDGLFGANEAGQTANRKPKVRAATKKVRRPSASVASRRANLKKGLPGVRSNSTLFGILGSGEKNHDLDEPVEVASVTAQARRGNFGLLLQTKNVRVNCFPAKLVRLLKKVERRFGRTPIITSGYRSRAKNRRIRGARNSTHISCKAADLQVKGVSKWKVAKYLRSLPGRGGVGTYCHTKSVHIDIGVKRDWNWRCRRKRRK